jgi:preprotein translocase subunit SecG
MATVVLTIHLILAFALIVVVLLQRSEGGGLGIGGGGGGGGLMSGRSAATALSKVTWLLGIAFVATSLTLTVIAARQSGTGSVLDRIGTEQVDPAAPSLPPGLGEDLLPPGVGTSPLFPPADNGAAAPAEDGPLLPPADDAPADDAPLVPPPLGN